MYKLFLKLLGVRDIEDGSIDSSHIYFSNLKTSFHWLLFILASLGAGYAVWWFYKREPDYVSLRKRKALAGLRIGGVLILLLICAGPVLEVFIRGYVKGKVVILVDNSKSMTRVDKYSRPEDKLIAAQTLGKVPLTVTDPAKVDLAAEEAIKGSSRMDIMRAMFNHKDINFIENLQKQYEVEMVSFSKASDMKTLETADKKVSADVLKGLAAEGMVTEIGGALRKTVDRLKGQALAAIIVVTDGGNNKGEEPAVVAQDSPVRIFPIGIGVPEMRDASVPYVFIESKIFVDDLAPIYVRVKHRGFPNELAELIVTTSDGAEVARQQITLKEAGEQNEVIRFKPTKPGKFTFRTEIKLLNMASEDSEPGNNFKTREVEVINQKIEVLLIEADPRWEFRYLKNSLLRDKRVNCHILLRVPDMNELARNSPVYLKQFPTDEELFKYHVIIFGNMPNDGFFTEKDIDALRRFVIDEGGGMWFIAGKNNMPDSYKDSKLEQLLPIEFERGQDVTADDEQHNPITEPFNPVLTPEGRSHSITRLDIGSANASDDQNAGLWELVPDMYWYHKATRAKLGATSLLIAGERSNGNSAVQRGGPAPIMLTQQVGRGRVLYQAFADLWRMRYPAELGPDTLERFHGHVVQYLGLSKLLGRTARLEIITDKEEYAQGDTIKLSARVMNTNLENSTDTARTAIITDLDNDTNTQQIELMPEAGQRGMFARDTVALNAGRFRVTLKDEDENAHADYGVVVPQFEMETPELKKELLENVAKSSVKGSPDAEHKARMYFPNQAGELLKDLTQAQRMIEGRRENTLWDAPLLLILFTLFMGTEWFIRKRSDLL